MLLRTNCFEEVAEKDEVESYLTEKKDEAKSLSDEVLRALKSVGEGHYH